MIGMALKSHRAKFLDSPHVMAQVGKAERRVLNRQGGMVRTYARNSMPRKRYKKPHEMSPAEVEQFEGAVARAKALGKPRPKRPVASSEPGEPPMRQTGALRKGIFYSFDPRTRSVVVGPERESRKDPKSPATLEFGGTSSIGGRLVRIEARPYMGPAMESATQDPKFDQMWRNSVK